MASKNKDQLAGTQAKVSTRDLKQQQKFRALSKADDASTTGQLINPVGAVIPNPTGAGGQAGAQGNFGSGNPSTGGFRPSLAPVAGNAFATVQTGAGTNLPSRGGRRPTGEVNQNPAPNGFQQIWDIYTNPNTYTSPFTPKDTSVGGRRPKGGDVNPMLASNVFSSVQTGAGASQGYSPYPAYANSVNNSQNQSTVYPAYANSVRAQQAAAYQNEKDAATQAYLQGEKGYVPIPAPELARLEKERQALNKANAPYPYGTAGMYTYGQFSDKDQAFTQLLAAGIPTTIPAAIADNLGLSQTLQDPASGWKLQNGAWVNTGATTQAMNPGNTEYTQTQFYRDYVSNEVPFEEQLRYDPRTGKYVRVGDWLKNKNDPRHAANASRAAKQAQKRRQAYKMGWDELQASQGWSSPIEEKPATFTGSWGVVSFNTGSG